MCQNRGERSGITTGKGGRKGTEERERERSLEIGTSRQRFAQTTLTSNCKVPLKLDPFAVLSPRVLCMRMSVCELQGQPDRKTTGKERIERNDEKTYQNR